MDVGSIIILAFIIVFIVIFTTYSLELFIPIHLKFEVNGICRSYIYEIEANGFLKEESKEDLITKLESLGLTDITIDISGDKGYGNYTNVLINSKYPFNKIVGIFQREDREIQFRYARKLFNRKIVN